MAVGLYLVSSSLSQEVAIIMKMYLVVPLWLLGCILCLPALARRLQLLWRCILWCLYGWWLFCVYQPQLGGCNYYEDVSCGASMAGGLYFLSTSHSQEVATIMKMYLVVPLWLVGCIFCLPASARRLQLLWRCILWYLSGWWIVSSVYQP
jgi:hypothetical protein